RIKARQPRERKVEPAATPLESEGNHEARDDEEQLHDVVAIYRAQAEAQRRFVKELHAVGGVVSQDHDHRGHAAENIDLLEPAARTGFHRRRGTWVRLVVVISTLYLPLGDAIHGRQKAGAGGGT